MTVSSRELSDSDNGVPPGAAPPTPPPCPFQKPVSWRERLSRRLQYAYFLRFPILAALFLPILILLDLFNKSTTITRGIFTLHGNWQAINAAFFIASLHMTILINVRNIVINGEERFRSPCPQRLCEKLTDPAPRTVWSVLAWSHLLTLIELFALGCIAGWEDEKFGPFKSPLSNSSWYIILYFLIGCAFSLAFWYLVSLFYYWSYRQSAGRPKPSALLFPHFLFGDIMAAVPPRLGSGLDRWLIRGLGISRPGYAGGVNGPLYELHFLSVVSLIGTFLLYYFLYALTAPVPGPTRQISAQVIAVLMALFFLQGLVRTQPTSETGVEEHSRWGPWVKVFFILFTCFLVVIFCLSVQGDAHYINLAFAFPALASILLVLAFFVWFLSTLSFFFDRYRVPVLLIGLFIIFVPKWLLPINLEHYFEVEELRAPLKNVPDPAFALKRRGADDQPSIIVTASGGGIQAAYWTSQVMARLESAFAKDPALQELAGNQRPYTFHDHLLLASGVSGGSLGLMPYLLEYTAPVGTQFPNTDVLHNQLTRPSACSSLEAVTWGLSYYDLYRLLLTIHIPDTVTFNPKDGNVWQVATDRSWALSQAFNRNLNDSRCGTEEASGPKLNNGNSFTLSEAARSLRDDGTIPAFTFNTTAAETGGRFLLSNYEVPQIDDKNLKESDFIPAESFLQAYAQESSSISPHAYADLSIATAARLSATFPYISSGTRIHERFAKHAFHFLDGGYFDNDGTASVIEFLTSALDCLNPRPGCPSAATSTPQPEKGDPAGRAKATAQAVHNILLIEIRDGDDLDPENQDDLNSQETFGPEGKPKDWGTVSQITAPLLGMWNAGHESISRRNRRELCLLEKAYKDRLHIHHVVFTIPPDKDRISPLNWHLTERQRKYVEDCASRGSPKLCPNSNTDDRVQEAVQWVAKVRDLRKDSDRTKWKTGLDDWQDDVCHTAPLASRSAPLSK